MLRRSADSSCGHDYGEEKNPYNRKQENKKFKCSIHKIRNVKMILKLCRPPPYIQTIIIQITRISSNENLKKS